MQSLGRSVLGIDLNERADVIAEHMHVASSYTADRALRPVRAPRWLPTPARRRARAAVAAMREVTDEMLQACRADPTRDAPLVQALIAATDPETGQSISDEDISNDLLIFMLAGHDTTATALTYALWVLGHHPDMQDRVAAEAAAIGDRELTPEDVPRLGYTVQVLHEALRLCPPAAGVARLATRDIAVDGYRVEAGSLMAVGIYAPAPGSGPVAATRWSSTPTGSARRAPRAATAGSSFRSSAERRSCIGEHFARLETTLALATIVRAMEIRSLDEDFPSTCRSPRSPRGRSGPDRRRSCGVDRSGSLATAARHSIGGAASAAPPARTAAARRSAATAPSRTAPLRPSASRADRSARIVLP